jgi:ribosomal protein S14
MPKILKANGQNTMMIYGHEHQPNLQHAAKINQSIERCVLCGAQATVHERSIHLCPRCAASNL